MNIPPFVVPEITDQSVEGKQPSLDLGTTCPCFEEAGECRLGFKCRFLGAHASMDESGVIAIVIDEEKKSRVALTNTELNQVSAETLKLLRQKKVGYQSLFFVDKRERVTNVVPETYHRRVPQRAGDYEPGTWCRRGCPSSRRGAQRRQWPAQ
jgi:hypothetical protein